MSLDVPSPPPNTMVKSLELKLCSLVQHKLGSGDGKGLVADGDIYCKVCAR